jgi:hypothetical protein
VAGAVLDELDQFFVALDGRLVDGLVEYSTDVADEFDVLALALGADVVRLADVSLLEDRP